MYDVNKLLSVSFQVKIPVLLSFVQFGTGVNSEALISNSSQKIRYKYVLKEENAILTKTEIFAQALLDKSIAIATALLIDNYFR